jgi:ankyrin repeat protein
MLLESGADPHPSAHNPLLLAIKNKNYKVMRLLYKYGGSPDSDSKKDMTPMQFALEYNDARLL